MTDGTLNGKTVLITGGGRGIGAAAARMFAQHGASVALASRTWMETNALADEIKQAGGQASAYACDVADAGDVRTLIHDVMTDMGGINILLNCAGLGVLGSALELAEDDFDTMLNTNLKGVWLVTKTVIPHMLQQGGGHVLTPVGVLGRYVMRNSAGYSASKFGTVGLLKAMAEEFNRKNIGFTLLYLGGVDTQFWDKVEMKVQRDKMLSAGDAAQAIVYAASMPPGRVLNEIVMQPDSHQFV